MPNLKTKPVVKKVDEQYVYPTKEVALCVGDNALAAQMAKTLLGWLEPKQGSKFANAMFKDRDKVGVGIVCTNNSHNRPFYATTALQWMFEILVGNWKFNGESIIIGRNGQILDGQHRLIGLVWAVQEWLKDPLKYPFWKTMPTIETLLVFGVDEDINTVNTLNTGRPRSLTDAIYASKLFDVSEPKQAKQLSRVVDYTVRTLWVRTGYNALAFSSRRTHAESLGFVDKHPTILKCVQSMVLLKEMYPNIDEGLTLGYSAGLMYLMAASLSTSENKQYTGYRQVAEPTEDCLDMECYSMALEFWTNLAHGYFKGVDEAIGEQVLNGTGQEAVAAVVIKAWNVYQHGDNPTYAQVLPMFAHDGEGYRELVERPLIDGIDQGMAN